MALKRIKGGHAPGTCEWIIHTKELDAWLGIRPTVGDRQVTQVLWLYGNPGTGKSTLAIYLTEELLKSFSNMAGGTMVYFFCNSGFEKQKTATSVLRGLIHQLVGQHEQLLDYLLPKYLERGAKVFESFDALWEIFMTMATDQSTGRKYCIIDALDECDPGSQKTLLAQLESFQSQEVSLNVRILVISRPYSEIREILHMFPNVDLASFPERQKDIELFIEEKVNYLAKRKKYTDKIKVRIAETLRDKAEGTFLWVGLACDELKDISSSRAISVLQSIPRGLDSLYDKLLRTALEKNETSCDDVRHLLNCVAVCSRPLTVSELSEACQLYQEEEDIETRLQFTREYIESCRLMIIIQEENVLLLHKSVKDYLFRSCSVLEAEAHARLAYRCIDLLTETFRIAHRPQTSFLAYATFEWAHHMCMAMSSFKVQSPQADFFQINSPCREHWLEQLRSGSWIYQFEREFSIFHVAAYLGVSTLVDYALDLGVRESDTKTSTHVVHVDCMDSSGRTPLEYAALSGCPNTFLALLSHGGKITARVVAAAAGNWWNGKEVMAILLNHWRDQSTVTDDILSAFAEHSDDDTMTLFLDRFGDYVTITNGVLKAAAGNWRVGAMELLLDRYGDQITTTDEVLKAVAENIDQKKEKLTMLLGRSGGQITMFTGVLKAAAENIGHGKKILTMLLDRSGDQITITDEVLKTVAGKMDVGVMKLLLDRYGGQITITDEVKASRPLWRSGNYHRRYIGSYGKKSVRANA